MPRLTLAGRIAMRAQYKQITPSLVKMEVYREVVRLPMRGSVECCSQPRGAQV